MPDKVSLDLYAAILKLKAENKQCLMAEVFATNLMNQSPYYTILKPSCEICEGAGNELHHLAGRKHDYHTITVCEECHRTLSDRQKLWDARWWKPDQKDEIRAAFLLHGISDILRLKTRKTDNTEFEMLADRLTEPISKRLRR